MYKDDNFFIIIMGSLIVILFCSFSIYISNTENIIKLICKSFMMFSTIDIILLVLISYNKW
jgi:hypothetical protein